MLIRWEEANPAVVSFDGQNYFYADKPSEVKDGTMAIIGLVKERIKQTHENK